MKDTIRKYIQERIKVNHLPLNIDEVVAVVESYETIYADKTPQERFFLYVLNQVGAYLTDIDEDMSEILGWLHVHQSKEGVVYLLFETPEDYYNWLNVRVELYSKLPSSKANNYKQLRLLNFLELSTLDFISDITSNCKYEYRAPDQLKFGEFKKTGYGQTKTKDSFIKYIGSKFKQNYTFKPTKP